MAAKKIGDKIKEARTAAGLTQAALAKKLSGDISAADISKAERGEKELTQTTLKEIAKATGVTQASLLGTTAKKTGSSGKTASSAKTSSSKTTSGTSIKVTAAEKKILELYRAADADTKKEVQRILKGEAKEAADILGSILGTAVDLFGKK